MMKKPLVLTLILGLVSGANAALSLVGEPTDPIAIGETITIGVESDAAGAYSGWLSIEDPAIADFQNVVFTAEGDPSGNSTVTPHPEFGAWYEFTVASFSPTNPIAPGEHIQMTVTGIGEGATTLTLYASDGVTALDSANITVVPEPMTIALLGLASLLLRRRA